MTDPVHIPLDMLKELFTVDVVSKEKINCIKLLRRITGEGLKETKEFFEQVVQPTVLNSAPIIRPEDHPEDLDEIREAIAELRQEVNKLNQQQATKMAKGLLS